MALEERFHLQLVVGVEHGIDRAAVVLEECTDNVPNHTDLWIVQDRSNHNRFLHRHVPSLRARPASAARSGWQAETSVPAVTCRASPARRVVSLLPWREMRRRP